MDFSDPQFLGIAMFGVFMVFSALGIFVVSTFTLKETTFEEAMATKRQKEERILPHLMERKRKDKGHDKTNKKKGKRNERQNGQLHGTKLNFDFEPVSDMIIPESVGDLSMLPLAPITMIPSKAMVSKSGSKGNPSTGSVSKTVSMVGMPHKAAVQQLAQGKIQVQVKGPGQQTAQSKGSGQQPAQGKGSGQQPAQGKASGQQPAQGKASGQQPAQGKASGQQPAQGKASGQQPAQGKDSGQQPAQGKGSGQQPAQGKGSGQQPAQGKGSGQQPAQGKGLGQQPAQGKMSGQQPAQGKGSGQQPAQGKGSGQQPAQGKGSGQQPAQGKESGQQPAQGKGSGQQPAQGKGSGQQPAQGKGSGQQPAQGKGSGQQPAQGKGSGQQPAQGKGSGQQPAQGKGSGQQPAQGKGSGQQPAQDKGSVQQPAQGKGSGQQPANSKGAAQQLLQGKSTAQQPSQGKGVAQQPPQGTGAAQQPPQGKGAAQQPPQGKGAAQQPPQGKGAAQQPPQGKGAAQQPPQGKGAAQQPPQGKGAGQQNSQGKGAGQQPHQGKGAGPESSHGKGASQGPSQGKGAGQQLSQGKGVGQQPSQGKGVGQQPSLGKGAGQQSSQGKGVVQQPTKGKGANQQPAKGKDSDQAVLGQQPTQDQVTNQTIAALSKSPRAAATRQTDMLPSSMPQNSTIPNADSDAALSGDKKKRKKTGKHEYSLPVDELVGSLTTEDNLKLAGATHKGGQISSRQGRSFTDSGATAGLASGVSGTALEQRVPRNSRGLGQEKGGNIVPGAEDALVKESSYHIMIGDERDKRKTGKKSGGKKANQGTTSQHIPGSDFGMIETLQAHPSSPRGMLQMISGQSGSVLPDRWCTTSGNSDAVMALRGQLEEEWQQRLVREKEETAASRAMFNHQSQESAIERAHWKTLEAGLGQQLNERENELRRLQGHLQASHNEFTAEKQELQTMAFDLQQKLDSSLTGLQQENAILREALANSAAQRDSKLNAELTKLRQEHARICKEFHDHKLQQQKEEKQQIDHAASVASYEQQLKQLKKEKKDTENAAKKAQTHREEVDAELKRLKDVTADQKATCEQAQGQLESAQQENRELTNQARREVEDLQGKLAEAHTNERELKEQLRTAQEVVDTKLAGDLCDGIMVEQAEFDKIAAELEERENKFVLIEQELATMSSGLEQQKQRNNDLREKNWKAMEALTSAEKLSATTRSDKDHLEQKLQAFQKRCFLFFQKLYPDVPASLNQVQDVWLRDFEQAAFDSLSRQQEEQSADIVNLSSQVQMSEQARLQSEEECEKYKDVLAETEGILKRLQDSVEMEEQKWQSRLADAESTLQESVMQKDSLEQKLHQFEQRVNDSEKFTERISQLEKQHESETSERLRQETHAQKLRDQLEESEQKFFILDGDMKKQTEELCLQRKHIAETMERLQPKVSEGEMQHLNGAGSEGMDDDTAFLKGKLEKEQKLTCDLSQAALKLQNLLKVTQEQLIKEREKATKLSVQMEAKVQVEAVADSNSV
uniref:ribosome-binding protein 1 isoform X2 n=2 Tax=Myxine glutinosa TaxID=7769 RepID=UPI00358F9353